MDEKGVAMLIGKNIKVETDEMNVTLFRRHVAKKTGKERWKALTYHATVRDALNELVRMKVNKTGLKDVQTVVDKLDEVKNVITKALADRNNS